eukprot:4216790-Pyramimonas_sp.AAC.1
MAAAGLTKDPRLRVCGWSVSLWTETSPGEAPFRGASSAPRLPPGSHHLPPVHPGPAPRHRRSRL